MEASHRLLQVQIWSEYQFDSKIQQRKKAEKESRGTLEYFVRLSGPENEVLAVAMGRREAVLAVKSKFAVTR